MQIENEKRNNVYSVIQKKGYRLTDARKIIIDHFFKAKNPETIQEVVKKVSVDETSVYRAIALFLSLDILEEIFIKGEQRYTLSEGHHHHIVCTKCGHTVHVPCDRNIATYTPKPHTDFVCIEDHQITYYGICTGCYL